MLFSFLIVGLVKAITDFAILYFLSFQYCTFLIFFEDLKFHHEDNLILILSMVILAKGRLKFLLRFSKKRLSMYSEFVSDLYYYSHYYAISI